MLNISGVDNLTQNKHLNPDDLQEQAVQVIETLQKVIKTRKARELTPPPESTPPKNFEEARADFHKSAATVADYLEKQGFKKEAELLSANSDEFADNAAKLYKQALKDQTFKKRSQDFFNDVISTGQSSLKAAIVNIYDINNNVLDESERKKLIPEIISTHCSELKEASQQYKHSTEQLGLGNNNPNIFIA